MPHNNFPVWEFLHLLAVERIALEQGHNDLREIAYSLHPKLNPRLCGLVLLRSILIRVTSSAAKLALDVLNDTPVVATQIDFHFRNHSCHFANRVLIQEAAFTIKQPTQLAP